MKMLYSDRIEVSEGIDVIRTSKSKECDIYDFWYLLNKGLKFLSYIWNGCYYLLIISMDVSDIAILNIKAAGYCCIISGISKSEIISLIQNIDLTEKNGWF